MDMATAAMTTMSEAMLPFIRVGAMLMVMPLIGTQIVPQRIRLILALCITVAILPSLKTQLIELPLPGTLGWTLAAIKELIIGAVHGLTVQMLFQVLVVGGQLIAMQAGLGFAQLMDPVNGVSVAAISQLYLLMANIVFFSSNGHLALIQVLSESFVQLPLGLGYWHQALAPGFLGLVSWMFAAGLLVALPAVTALLLVNIAFGVISKLSPQFNVLSFGFAFIVFLGIVIVAATLSRIVPAFDELTAEALLMLRGFYG